MKHLKLLSLFILATVFQLTAQNLRINAELDTNQILIGQQIYLKLKVFKQNGLDVGFPTYHDTITKNLEILEQFPIDTIQQNGMTLIEQTYKVTSFEPGVEVIPPLKFSLSHDGVIDTVTSNSLMLTVHAMQTDSTNAIFDIHKPYETPFSWNEFWARFSTYVYIGLLIILLIIFISIYIDKRRQNKPIFKPIKPKLPPHVIAFDELDKLKAEKLWQQEKVKLYYSRLTEIVRVYIEERYQIQAMEQTSDEILDKFASTKLLDSMTFENLQRVLKLADLVKFAKHRPLPDENDSSMRLAYEFVKSTLQSFTATENETQNEEKKEEKQEKKTES